MVEIPHNSSVAMATIAGNERSLFLSKQTPKPTTKLSMDTAMAVKISKEKYVKMSPFALYFFLGGYILQYDIFQDSVTNDICILLVKNALPTDHFCDVAV